MRRRNNFFLMLQQRRRATQLNRANKFNNRKGLKQNQTGSPPFTGGGFGQDFGGANPYGGSYEYSFGPGYGEYGYERYGPEGYYGRDFYYDYGPGYDFYGYDQYDQFYGYPLETGRNISGRPPIGP